MPKPGWMIHINPIGLKEDHIVLAPPPSSPPLNTTKQDHPQKKGEEEFFPKTPFHGVPTFQRSARALPIAAWAIALGC